MRRSRIAVLAVLACAQPAAASPEKPDRDRCRAIADAIGPLVKRIDALQEAVRAVDTSALDRGRDVRLRAALEEEGRARRAADRALGRYSGAVWSLHDALRNCEMAGAQAFQ